MFDNRGLSVRVVEIDSEVLSCVLGLSKEEWMDSIRLKTSTAIIISVLRISCPHSPSTFCKKELSSSLSESVEFLTWEYEVLSNILILERSSLISCGDKNISWISRVVEFKRERCWVSSEINAEGF